MALDTLFVDNQLSALLNDFFRRFSRLEGTELKYGLRLRLFVRKLTILDQLRGHKRQDLNTLFLGQNAFPRRHGRSWKSMRNRIEKVVLSGIRVLLVIV